jgi:aminoglycoside 6'-N-acetyltransferase
VKVTTARLVLREFAEGDAEIMWSWRVDDAFAAFLPGSSLEELRAFVRGVVCHPTRHHLMALEGGRPVGSFRIYERGAQADIGCVLERGSWGKGLATEGVLALLDEGFRRRRLHRIWATVDVENERSMRLVEKIGMRREARMRELHFTAGRWRDAWLYAMLDRDDHKGHITKMGPGRVRHVLNQASWAYLRMHESERRWYERVKYRRGGKRALVALMRRLAIVIWRAAGRALKAGGAAAGGTPKAMPDATAARLAPGPVAPLASA